MDFLAPYWLLALLIIPILLLCAIGVKRSQQRAWHQLVAPRLRKRLVHQSTAATHWLALGFGLLAFALTVVALARPFQGEQTTQEKLQSRNILIAIDTSRSMLCQDVSTNRLTAAKSFSLQMLKNLPTDRIGVLAFAGSSNVIAPLTIDHLAVHDTLAQLDANTLSRQGSNLAEAVSRGVDLLSKTGKRANALVIFSDGEEHDSGIDSAITEAKKAGVQIITIGVGTTIGGIIPSEESSDGKHRNNQGEVVHTKLHPALLQKLANETNGAYTSIQNSPKEVIKAALDQMKSFEQQGRQQTVPHERYQWFLAAAAACAILSSLLRAGWKGQPHPTLLALLLITLSASHAKAQDSWITRQKHQLFTKPDAKKKALNALNQGNFKEAAELFESAMQYTSGEERAQLSMALGQAHYRNADYAAATKAFTQALLSRNPQTQANAQYNLGNALFKNEIQQIGDTSGQPLEQHLLKRATASESSEPNQQSKNLSDTDLALMEKHFSNALEKYSSSQKITPTANSKANIESTQEVIQSIQNVRDKLKEQQDKKDDDKQDDQQKKKGDDKQDDQQKKKGDDKQDDQQKKKGDDKQDDQQKKKGDDKQDDQQKKKGDDKQDDQTPEKKDAQEPDSPAQAADQQQPSENGYNITEQEARDLLEKHADMQKRPESRPLNAWRNQNPDIDW